MKGAILEELDADRVAQRAKRRLSKGSSLHIAPFQIARSLELLPATGQIVCNVQT